IDPGSGDLEVMKTVFNRARDYSPSIVFIDEIDTFGSRQKNGSKAVINELLTQINGFSENPDESIFIIAATNHKDDIDSAILRPGRIELHIEIPTLDTKGREYFINKMLEKPCEKNIDVSKLVMYSAGMTGAQLEKVSNESSLYALRYRLSNITEDIILEHINIEKYGHRVTGKSIEEMLGETAYHEAGHAVISKVLNPDAKIEQITVTPREDTLGFVSYDVEGSNSNPSKKDLENKICVAYAGRVAQMKQYGEDGLDTGASSDLKQATKIAFLMVSSFGMDEEFGDISVEGALQVINHNNNLLDNTFLKSEVEQRVKENLKSLKTKTEELVSKHWTKIDKLANELLEKEVVHEEELNKLMNIK
ncbi:MAG: AAA family ATPase, partial [Campylobacterota bacterium]|nr:AAA family ATPase [Campylobacterota bacterium]